MWFLVHDRDSKYTASFDEVVRSEGIRIIPTPVRAPRANAHAERFVRTVRNECLDWLPILGRRHLERVHTSTPPITTASARIEDSRSGRPTRHNSSHRPAVPSSAATASAVYLLHEYYRAAA